MAFSWKRFTIFGFCMTVPFVAFIIRSYVTEERASAFKRFAPEMATCERCHKLFSVRAGLSFLMHLQDVHGIEQDRAMEIVDELYRRLIARRGSKAVA